MALTNSTSDIVILNCLSCGQACQTTARFCGNCGSLINQRLPEFEHRADLRCTPPVPGFAYISPDQEDGATELKIEAGELMLQLARERLFLYLHWLLFLTVNLFGFWVAIKSYNEFVGDQIAKLMIGSTPLLYINALALLCLVPINGTKKEIFRLKERLHYLKLRIEYHHLR